MRAAFCFYRAGAGSGGGLDEIVADPEPQQIPSTWDIAVGPGMVTAQRDLLPDTETTPLAHTRRPTQSPPLRSGPTATGVEAAAATTEMASLNRAAGVSMFSD